MVDGRPNTPRLALVVGSRTAGRSCSASTVAPTFPDPEGETELPPLAFSGLPALPGV